MRNSLTASLLSLGLLTACSVQPAGLPQGQSPRFQLAQLDAPGTISVNPASQEKPTSKGTETLIVNIGQFLSKFRRVLAVPAAVHKVVITVTAADGTIFTEILDLAALTSGQTSVTFNGLVPGEASIRLEAFDASNAMIGSSSDTAQVTPGVVAQKEMNLSVGNAPNSGGSGGSGGGGASAPSVQPTPPPGDLTTQVGLQAGPTLSAVTPWKLLAKSGRRIAFDASTTSYWTVVHGTYPMQLAQVSSAGAILKSYPIGAPWADGSHRLAVDRTQHFWIVSLSQDLMRISPTGQTLFIKEFWEKVNGILTAEMVIDLDNHLWLAFPENLYRVSPAGDIVSSIPLDEPLDMLVLDPNSGVLWGASRRGNSVLKVQNGAATPIPVASKGSWNGVLMDLDNEGHLWLPRREAEEVLELAQDGSVLNRFRVPGVQGVFCDKAGAPWILDEAGVYRLDANGQPAAGYAIPGVTYATMDQVNGTVWLIRNDELFPMWQ